MENRYYKKAIKFYTNLSVAIMKWSTTDFPDVRGEFESLRGNISLGDLTTTKIEKARSELATRNTNGPTLIEFSRAVFKDFAPHLRDPEVRKLITKFRFPECDDLYIQIGKFHLLADRSPFGPAVVTVTVDCFDAFVELLKPHKNDKECHRHVHYSFGEEINELTVR